MLHRPTIGILAAILLLTGGTIFFAAPGYLGAAGAFLRVGFVLGALWLALPDRMLKMAWWFLALLVIAAAGFTMFPAPVRWSILIATPVVAFLFLPQIFAAYRAQDRAAKAAPTAKPKPRNSSPH